MTTLETAGDLALDGTAVTANQVITKADLDDGDLVFTPAANAHGAAYATFGFKVNDGTADSAAAYTMTVAVTAVNDDPSGAPTISGTPTQGQTLSAVTAGIADPDGLGPFRYQWRRAGEGGGDIPGATGASYTLGQADVGRLVHVRVAWTDADGTGENITSAGVGPVANVNDAPTGVPTITGTATQGMTLSADTSGIGDVDGLGAFSYQWTRGSAAITGATAATYTPGQADVGATLTVTVSWTDGEGTAERVTSAATGTVANVNDAPTGANKTLTIDEDTPYWFALADFGFADVDGDSLASVKITTLASAGSLQVGGVDVTLGQAIPRTDFVDENHVRFTPAANANGTPYATFGFKVNDGTADSAAAYTITINVSAVNDAPAFSPASAARSIPENTGPNVNVGAVIPAATDPDSGDTLTYALGGTDAASFNFNTATRQLTTKAGITYDHEARSTYTVTVTADDNNGGTGSVTVTVTVTDVNEPPAAPAAPALAPTAGSTTTGLTVTWTAPGNTGKPAITGYDVRYRKSGVTDWTNGPQNVSTTSAALTGLAPGTTYQAQVRAANAEGDGDWSANGAGTTAAPAVSITAGAAITEGANATFSLSATPAPAAALTVSLTITQSGMFTTLTTATATVGTAGTGSLSVATVNDTADEAAGAVTATLKTPADSSYTVAPGAGAATVTVNDNDATAVTLTAAAGDVPEGGTKTLTLATGRALVAGESLTAPLTFAGTATRGTDYTLACATATGVACTNLNSGAATVTFTGPAAASVALTFSAVADGATTDSDNENEVPDETVDLGLGALTHSGLNGGAAQDDSAAGLAFALLGEPLIVVDTLQSAVTEGTTLTFTLSRAQTGAAVTVRYTVADAEGSDFLASTTEGAKSIAFGATETEQTITLPTVADTTNEQDGPVTVTVNDGTGYTVGAARTATVTVRDDDGADITMSPDSLYEGETVWFTLSGLAGGSGSNINVAGTPGTATVNTDYRVSTRERSPSSLRFRVEALADSLTEGDETIRLLIKLSNNPAFLAVITLKDGPRPNRPPVFASATLTRSLPENSAAGTAGGAPLPAATDPDSGDTLTYT
ncbi:MAG: hypothetical protein F4056_04015, partial [Chloroflexi bacterium]|nr:hypothetical protein [Chloroflexota bacterium]